jgi:hypothetical protein
LWLRVSAVLLDWARSQFTVFGHCAAGTCTGSNVEFTF